ncbi:MAG: Phosphoenolpyruvate synthase, partial [Candidatus Magasanikbacteria bacterium GW2011_GWA2_42_32]
MYIKRFSEISIKDIPSVGGKNASLGEMYSNLTQKGIKVPDGFAVTADAFRHFLSQNKLDILIKQLLHNKHSVENVKKLAAVGKKIRTAILTAKMPAEISAEIIGAYKKLGGADVAVRSSATAEDLPQASFAGQQESYLNVKGEKNLLEAVQKCYASLFTDRAISYRLHQGFSHEQVALSAGVQKMVRS